MIFRTIDYLRHNRARILRVFREGGWIAAGQVASVLGALVLVRVLTEYLSPSEYGELSLGLTIAGLVNQVAMGGLTNGIGRFYSIAFEKADLWGYVRASARLMGYATLFVCMVALALVVALFVAQQLRWLGLMSAVLVFSILNGHNSALNGIQNAARQRAVVALHSGINAWLKVGLAFGTVLFLTTSSTAVVAGYALSTLLVNVSQLYFLKHLLQQQIGSSHVTNNDDWVRQIWLFSWPFSAWGLFVWLQQVSDRWALEAFASTQDVGQYVVVFQLGYVPIGLVSNLMMTLVGPVLYQRFGTGIDQSKNITVHQIVWRIAGISVMVTLVAFVFTLFSHDLLFQWLVGPNFRSISHCLPWVVMAGGLFAAGQILSLQLMTEIRSKELLIVKIGTAILGVAINLLGAWLFGIAGVVMGLLAFSTFYFVWITYLVWFLPDQCLTKEFRR